MNDYKTAGNRHILVANLMWLQRKDAKGIEAVINYEYLSDRALIQG
jgi:hypothetical protein